jgi:hypothetical protein
MRVTFPAHLVLEFTILTTFGGDCKFLRSPLCVFLQRPITPSLLRSHILLSSLFLDFVSLCYLLYYLFDMNIL